jgi:hypothetical protein
VHHEGKHVDARDDDGRDDDEANEIAPRMRAVPSPGSLRPRRSNLDDGGVGAQCRHVRMITFEKSPPYFSDFDFLDFPPL